MAIPRHMFRDGGYYHDYQGVGDTCVLCHQTLEEIQNQGRRTTMTGYERAVEYLIMRGGGAALNALVEEGYEGDGVDYDKLLETFKKNDKAVEDLPKHIKDLQFHGQIAQEKSEYELMVFGHNLSEIKKALDCWDGKKEYPYPIVITEPTLYELVDAAEQLLAWQPVCSLGSSGDLRQKRLKNALDRFKGVS